MNGERAARLTKRGYQYHKRGWLKEALEVYQRVVRERPDYPDAWHHAALATRQLCAHARSKGLEPPWDASTLMMVRALEESTRIMQTLQGTATEAKARKLYAAMVFNFGWFQQDRGVLEGASGARVMYETAAELDPELGEAWTNLGNVFGELGNRMRAEACWLRALELPSPTAESQFNLSFLLLRRGDWRAGWQMYESRWQSPVFLASYGRPDITAPVWDGSSLDGPLLLHGEQGAGDVIMTARWVRDAIERSGNGVIVEVPESLVTLFRRGFIDVLPQMVTVGRGESLPEHAAQLSMMSLPAIFSATTKTLPNPARWVPRAPESRRIGVCWRGSPTHPNDRTRSMPVETLAPLLEVPGFAWQSLQFGIDDVAELEPLITTDYLDTAKEIARCALVITVDTSVAHLAGSIGVPTYLLLPFHAEWRWMEGGTTPWYRSVQLFRQERPGDWHSVISPIRSILRNWPECAS